MDSKSICNKSLRNAYEELIEDFGELSDLPDELVNTLANIYYRFYILQEHLGAGGNTPFLTPYIDSSSSVMRGMNDFNAFSTQTLSAFKYAKELIDAARNTREQNNKFFHFLVTLTLDILKYDINNASTKSPLRRFFERRLKKVREIENLLHIMKLASRTAKDVGVESSDDIEKQRDRAMQLMAQSNYKGALNIFINLLKSEKKDWSIYYMAGQCCRLLDDIPRAIRSLKIAAKLNPNEPSTFLALGIVFQLAEQYEEAVIELKKAIKLAPNLYSAYISLGLTYRKWGKTAEAIEWYKKAEDGLVTAVSNEAFEEKRAFDSKPKTLDDRLNPYYVDVAIANKLRSDVTYATILNNMGVCLLEMGDADSARDKFCNSVNFTPDGVDYPDPIRSLESMGYKREDIEMLLLEIHFNGRTFSPLR